MECQNICQIEGQNLWQIECRIICQIEFQNLCQIDYQNTCQMECESDGMSELMSDGMSEYMPDCMSDRMSDLCQIECQNVCHIECQNFSQLVQLHGLKVGDLSGGSWVHHTQGQSKERITGYLKVRKETSQKPLDKNGRQAIFVSKVGDCSGSSLWGIKRQERKRKP